MKVLVAQSHPTLCDPVDHSLPGSCVHGILQARILEWVAISFSRGNLPNSGNEPKSPALQAYSLASEAPGKPHKVHHNFYMYWEAKKNCVTHFIAIFALLQWSGTKSTVSPRCAYIRRYRNCKMSEPLGKVGSNLFRTC